MRTTQNRWAEEEGQSTITQIRFPEHVHTKNPPEKLARKSEKKRLKLNLTLHYNTVEQIDKCIFIVCIKKRHDLNKKKMKGRQEPHSCNPTSPHTQHIHLSYTPGPPKSLLAYLRKKPTLLASFSFTLPLPLHEASSLILDTDKKKMDFANILDISTFATYIIQI